MQTVRDECHGVTCQPNAKCVDDQNNYLCQCSSGLYGAYCDNVLLQDNPTNPPAKLEDQPEKNMTGNNITV